MIELVIHGEVPSQKNTLRFAGGRAFYANNEVKHYKAAFSRQVPAKLKTNMTGPVMIDVDIFLKDRRKDGHNCLSVVYDALEFAGVIKNDRQIISGVWNTWIDKKNPRVEIKLTHKED